MLHFMDNIKPGERLTPAPCQFARRVRGGRHRNYQDPFGNTLLHIAVVSGDLQEVKRLLAAGANAGIANRDGRTALHAAEVLGHAEIQKVLGPQLHSLAIAEVRLTPGRHKGR